MRINVLQTGIINWSRLGILSLAIALVACSHDVVTTPTEPVKTETAVAIPDAPKPEPTKPADLEPTKPEPVTGKPVGNATHSKTAVLKPGQSASLDVATTLQYVRLVSDSRCPVDAQCIWAGEATIELTLESGKEKQTFTLSDRANTKEATGFAIELVSIDRSHQIEIRSRKL